MKRESNNVKAFFALLRAGLWETDLQLLPYGEIDFTEIYRLAEEQSVIGLITAGLNHVVDTKVLKRDLLQFIGATIQQEEHNKAMNCFIGVLVDKMRRRGIYTLMVKGQGIAQCYEKPLWRACGDVDFFLSGENYVKAKEYLVPLASSVEQEGEYGKHLGMTIDRWVVELHGNLRCGLSSRMDRVLEEVQTSVFHGGNVRSWMNDQTQVFLPGVDSDVVFVFTHFLKHFYRGGIGLRQICDWSRLMWKYRNDINLSLLERRLKSMGLMTEWKAFGDFAVDYLGIPADALPLYDNAGKWHRKADRIQSFILKTGNFGHNRDSSHFSKYPYLIRKVCSLGVRIGDLVHHMKIFPWDSLRFFPRIVINGLRSAANGE